MIIKKNIQFKHLEKEQLIEFIKWLKKERSIENIFEMYADQFLEYREKEKELLENSLPDDYCKYCGKAPCERKSISWPGEEED